MSMKSKCIFCYAQIFDSLSSFENSDEANDFFYRGGKTNLKTLCRILKIPRTSYSSEEYSGFEAPICFTCDNEIRRIKEFLQDLKNIRSNLYEIRKKLLSEMIKSTNAHDTVKNEARSTFPESSFLKIRKAVLKDLSNTITVDDLRVKQDEPTILSDFDQCDGSDTPPRLDDISEGLPLPSPSQSFTSELMPSSPPKILSKAKLSKRFKKAKLESNCLNPCFEDSVSSHIGLGAVYPSLNVRKVKSKGKKEDYLHLYHQAYNTGDSSDDEKQTVQIKSVPDPTWASAQGSFGLDFDSSQSQTLDSLPDGQHYAQPIRGRKQTLPSNFSKIEKQPKNDTLKSSVRQIEIHVIGSDGKSLESIQTVGVVEDDVPQTLTVEGMLQENLSVVSFSNQMYDNCYPCNDKDCDKVFPDKHRMNIHHKKVHQGIALPYQCSDCSKSFKTPRLLKAHILKRCVHSLDVPSDANNPKKIKRVNIKNHKCDHCPEKFRNPGELTIHIRRVHTGETPFVCTQSDCDKSFVSALRLEFHTEQDHNEIAPLKCEFCGKGFFREHRLRDHRKIHTGEKSYLCEICSKSFTQPAYLRYHQTQHDELNFQPYKCDKCNKRFATPANLKLHVTTQHEKFYRYRCEICNHGSTHMSHLKLHMRSHTGERPFQCQICSKGFMRGAQLNIHLRSHTGDRPYKCGSCGKGFTNSSKLRRHELLHKDEKPFQCNECGKSYTTKSYLKNHQKTSHGDKSALLEPISSIVVPRLDKPLMYIEEADDSSNIVLHDNSQHTNLFPDEVETTVQYGEFILL